MPSFAKMRGLTLFTILFTALIVLASGCVNLKPQTGSKPEIIDSIMNKSTCLSYIKSASVENGLLQLETNASYQICQNSTLKLTAGEEATICLHHHGNTVIKVDYIMDDKAQFKVIETFDHKSFGPNLITHDICTVSVSKTEFQVQ